MFLTSKQDYQEKLFEILNPLVPHYSSGQAKLTLGCTGAVYPPAAAEMEGFARVLWGLAPYFCGGGTNKEFEEIYLHGLTHGTDPNHPEYWGTVSDYNQELVEMAAIAVGLLLAPEKLWTPLSPDAKSNLVNWLNQANFSMVHHSNWQFFPILVNAAFKKLGCKEYNQEVLNVCLEAINGFYVGDGWYQDGCTGRYDYYVAFALHYYGLIYSVFMNEEDPVNSQNFKDRAAIFGKQFLYWFDESGAGVPYGRSLTYRFAQVAFYSACIYAGVETLDLPTMKGIIDRSLSVWWQSHMRDFSGILTIGYEYPNLNMAESYNAPGSPLWALKAFLLLALADGHPYWSAQAAPYPSVEPVKLLPKGQMILTHHNGNTIMYPNGLMYSVPSNEHMDEKYGKFAYSSKFGFSVHIANDSLENMAPDNDLVFEIGGLFFGRRTSRTEIAKDKIISNWSPFEGIDIQTELSVSKNSYSAKHTIISKISCTAYACGFAIPRDSSGYTAAVNDECANIITDMGGCKTGGGPGVIIEAAPNTNLLYPRTSIPAVKFSIGVGQTVIKPYCIIFP